MKIRFYILFIITLSYFSSCQKQDRYERCQELKSKSIYKSSAISNYIDFNGFAQFFRISIQDSLNRMGKNGIALSLIKTDDYCLQKEKISFSDIILKKSDTIYIDSSEFVKDRLPTADYFIKDHDAILDYYDIMPSAEFESWIVIEEINSDTTEIFGKFKLAFSRKYPDHPIDDPNRPQAIYFTQGNFLAEYSSH